ncbi:hypothetical protein CTI12_AA396120 [Artemisia annua]|uniref:Homologous recombination OB-fold protein OB-fold domain-containing protein n=1 Tax=Artemisia annua TaxID=35608 RepID=A0A2U1MC60_ARTAN|nr:hypothetical protein CTI12_AA396120 [Artemisia annua]
MDKSDNFNNPLHPCNNHHQSRHRTPTLENVHSSHNPEKPVRTILGPAGIVQLAKGRKQAKVQEDGQECVISTQEYIRKVVEDMGEDDDFTRGPWLNAVKFSFINNGKIDQVVAIINSYNPNALGDLIVTLKDLLGSIHGAIHHKIINEGGYGKYITVGATVILHNVLVFSPK